MKHFILIFIFTLLFSAEYFSQSLIERTVKSRYVGAGVPIKVWVPNGYSKNQKYPVIYEFVYDHTNFIAGTASNLYEIPKCIVVYTGIKTGNEHYSSPYLNEAGQKYYNFLKDELIPLIERDYSASGYRVALGLSQGADYANYVFRNNPELFSAYMIFASEKPNYKVNYPDYIEKLPRPVDYFIATGNDESERVEYAKNLYEQFSKSSKVRTQISSYERAEHRYVILYALPDALNFVFDDFVSLRKPRLNENSYQYFTNLQRELKTKYGTEPALSRLVAEYLAIVVETKDATNIVELVTRLELRLNELDLFNLGYAAAKIGQYDAAERFLNMSIKRLPAIHPKVNPVLLYRTIALNIYDKKGDTASAFNTLKKGHEMIKSQDIGLLYYLGRYAIEKNYHAREGVEALIFALNNREKSNMSGFFPSDDLAVTIAKGYLLLNQKNDAELYLKKALEINAENSDAKDLLEKLEKP